MNERSIEVGRIQGFLERLRELGAEALYPFSFDDGLTPAEGEVVALFYNADLREARLAAGVALANFENAGLWDDPEFGFDGAEILSPSGSPFEFGLTLNLTIPISGRLEVEKTRAGAAYEAELRRIVDAEWATRADVRRSWASWTVAEERLRLLREAIAQIERITAITDRLEAGGELSRVESRLFQVELADRRAAVAEAELDATRSRINLLGLMGLPADASVELVPALPTADPPLSDDPLRRLIESNTELAVRRAEYQVVEEALRLEIRKQYPDITIGSGYGSEDNDDRLILGFSVPIPIFNRNRAGIAEARAERDVSRAAAETTFERLARELTATHAVLDAARTQRSQFESTIVPMLEAQAEEVEQIADLGEVDTLILLETVQRQLDAKSRLLELQRAELDASVTIAQLLGPGEPADPAPVSDHNDKNVATVEDASSAVGGER
ncbi:MAG: TolC family protein [Phycisphaerae bacterium]|nr:TolC family protein [Phycisphaerae bacterium]